MPRGCFRCRDVTCKHGNRDVNWLHFKPTGDMSTHWQSISATDYFEHSRSPCCHVYGMFSDGTSYWKLKYKTKIGQEINALKWKSRGVKSISF